MVIEAQLKWTDGMQFVARAGKGPAVVIDSRDGGSGPSPMELLLMGVAGRLSGNPRVGIGAACAPAGNPPNILS